MMTLAQISALNPLQVSASTPVAHGTSCRLLSPTCSLQQQPNKYLSPSSHNAHRVIRKFARVYASAAPEESSSGASTPPEVVKKKTVRRVIGSIPINAASEAEAVRKVEEGGVAVEGVARVDRGAADLTPIFKLAALAGGDVASLILFTWIGRATHISTAVDWELLKSADPFIAGWAIAGYITKDFFPETPPPVGLQAAALRGLKTWALGAPLGIIIRGISKGQVPPGSFVGITMASTLVIVLSWRVAFAALSGAKQEKQTTKQGNPFEFFQLLSSLVKRW